MRAFIVGLLFLIFIAVLCVVCIILLPFLHILGFIIWITFALLFIITGIWALGKFIIMLWESLKKKPGDKKGDI